MKHPTMTGVSSQIDGAAQYGYPDRMISDKLFRPFAWLSLLAIIFVTVSPVGLRPHGLLPINLERSLAFFLMAGLFVAAYPRRWWLVLFAMVASAGLIEVLQFLSPTRHASLTDVVVKAGGATCGVIVALAFNRLRER